MTGALLAGGLSSRMGRDKCLLEIDGTPLWQRQLDVLAALCDEVCVVAPSRPAWCPETVPWIRDVAANRGPLAGLAAALERAECVLALAVDLPAMSADYLRGLIAAGAVVPELDGFYQPLCAVYPRAALPLALTHLEQPDHSLQSLLRDLISAGLMRAIPVTADERPLFRNLNTPND
jgi:molybdopterin-guanine dinucleotide biosynthesis protein A